MPTYKINVDMIQKRERKKRNALNKAIDNNTRQIDKRRNVNITRREIEFHFLLGKAKAMSFFP